MTDVQSPKSGRTALRIGAALLAGAAVLAVTPAAVAATGGAGSPGVATVRAGQADPAALRQALDALVTRGGGTAALGEVRDQGRTVWRGATGVADLDTGAPARADGRFRIGSATKTFVATVVLQLVGERRVELDAPIERYLPGVVRGGAGITVRQLLNHTSGLYDYLREPGLYYRPGDDASLHDWLAVGRWTDYSPQQLIAIANRHEPDFAPGTGWQYSNTNYIVAGLLIDKVTGHNWRQEVERRIIRPLGLTHTTLPTTATTLPGHYAHGYVEPLSGGHLDVTELNPSFADAAGSAISSTEDLTRFNAALLGGRLLRPAELEEMTTAHPTSDPRLGYGLGLMRVTEPCGDFWGHDGGIAGYTTTVLGDAGGRHQLALSMNPYDLSDPDRTSAAFESFVATAACGTGAPTH
ncbi:serine hydrolase domain-containing protein [Kitasatospora sp. NPDC056138]|uniref:serine hydrolase domain-containing protein n=1 Tax=Kitasatospora sp. NPDC056138 TaxID=3345724 RepID=UPI0035D5F4D8